MFEVPYLFSDNNHFRSKGIHLGICGSISAFRAVDLLRWWRKNEIYVSATLSDSAQRFITALTFKSLGAEPVYTDMWENEQIFGHLEPGQNCHAMVIAPASASTLAHLAHGHAHTLISCQALAFDGPLLVAPAMNPRMWSNPATKANIDILRQRQIEVIVPDEGNTACNDQGQGRLADIRLIWLLSLKALTTQDMQGKNVLITLGPTRESWDAVRFWSNPSTGTMGLALAICAWLRGARVHAVCGPAVFDSMGKSAGYIPNHPFLQCYHVVSAKEMYQASADLWSQMDMGIFTAAVADYSPKPYIHGQQVKFKKESAEKPLNVEFTRTTDILATLSAEKKAHQKILGFAAETSEDMAQAVRLKLARKNADILAGNNINQSGSGFGSSTNAMYVADKFGKEEVWPTLSKIDVAWRLCSWLMQI